MLTNRFRVACLCAGAAVLLSALAAAPAKAAPHCLDPVSGSAALSVPAPPVEKLLGDHPFGGLGLSNATRATVTANLPHAEAVLALLGSANQAQRIGLTRGLAQAALDCDQFQREGARRIRDSVAQLGDVRLAAAFGSVTPAFRLPSTVVQAQADTGRCYSGIAPASPEQVQAAMVSPSQLIAKHPLGGGALSSEIRTLVVSDPAFLSVIGQVVAGSSEQQRTAIAAGLAQAANACEVVAPAVTQAIQRAIITLSDPLVERTFASITGDRAVGATGAGGFGAAPAGGGGGPLGNLTTLSVGNQGQGGAVSGGSNTSTRFSFSVGSVSSISSSRNSSVSRFSVSP